MGVTKASSKGTRKEVCVPCVPLWVCGKWDGGARVWEVGWMRVVDPRTEWFAWPQGAFLGNQDTLFSQCYLWRMAYLNCPSTSTAFL
eukprot:337097-Pelagomonas_calceolata.AAC.2